MKTKLVVAVVVVLAALLVPVASWATFQSCLLCAQLGPAAGCTCPGKVPPISTICRNYPAGCQLNFKSAPSPQADKDAFLASLAAPSATKPSPTR